MHNSVAIIRQRAFTLLELILVILVISILSITVSSNKMDSEEINAQQQRDILLSLLRSVQQRTMHDVANLTTTCPTLVLTATAAGMATDQPCAANASFTPDSTNISQLIFPSGVTAASSTGNLPQIFRFNTLGQPQGNSCTSTTGCTITLSAAGLSYRICMNAEGFIRPC